MDEQSGSKDWYCIGCSHILGQVIGGEFSPGDDISGSNIKTRGPNLVVTCPKCETKKVWYTADPIVRSLYQLIDAIVSVAAKRMVAKVSAELRK